MEFFLGYLNLKRTFFVQLILGFYFCISDTSVMLLMPIHRCWATYIATYIMKPRNRRMCHTPYASCGLFVMWPMIRNSSHHFQKHDNSSYKYNPEIKKLSQSLKFSTWVFILFNLVTHLFFENSIGLPPWHMHRRMFQRVWEPLWDIVKNIVYNASSSSVTDLTGKITNACV